jgi:hypothetical protein
MKSMTLGLVLALSSVGGVLAADQMSLPIITLNTVGGFVASEERAALRGTQIRSAPSLMERFP